tara:strand:- start:897 stop:1088 length:192 start_codon:yes stop_codon:yes gene_type:complete
MVGTPLDVTSKGDRKAILLLLLTVTTLTAIHYYHQIKIARLKLNELEKIQVELEQLKADQKNK